MATIDLNNLKGIPKEFISELKKFDPLFREDRFLGELLDNNPISKIISTINDYCLTKQVFGYHYTRAIPNEIQHNGLICRNGNNIRQSFMANFGHYFTEEEIYKITKAWSTHFNTQQHELRDGSLYFNFTTAALDGYGAEPLLSNFGGEQVYMPLQELPGISEKIKRIGRPLIVKCKLDPNRINTFYEQPWGRIAVSTYHCKINQEAHRDDQDGYQYFDVEPGNLEIIEYNEKKDIQ